jgi:hypothetical protein
MRCAIVALAVIPCLCTAPTAQAQPPGPATKLLMINSIDEDVVFTVETGSQTTLFVINKGSTFASPLRKTTDDRVIYASKAGQGRPSRALSHRPPSSTIRARSPLATSPSRAGSSTWKASRFRESRLRSPRSTGPREVT